MRWTRRSKDAETAEQSLARLNASGAVDPAAAPSAGPRFPVVRLREGYDMAEVDAFYDNIHLATRQQVLDKQFTTTRLREGYDMEAVDKDLDRQADRLPPDAESDG
jgi:DivIVA domain-containing protein